MHRQTLEQLYRRYGPMVLRRARALLRDEQAARDALQEVFLRAMRALRSHPELARAFQEPAEGNSEGTGEGNCNGDGPAASGGPATWLYRVTTNYCLNARRDGARRQELWSLHAAREEPARAALGFARVQLAQIFAAISPEMTELAHYFLVDELTHEEIAALYGVSRRTIGYRLDELRAVVRGLDATVAEAS